MPLRILAVDLVEALTTNPDGDAVWVLDSKTGDISLLQEGEEPADDDYVIEAQLSSRDGYRLMERFVREQRDSQVHDVLATAIEGRGAFRRFKDALFRWPEVRDAWFDFEFEFHLERARQWLEDEEVDAELILPPPDPPKPPPSPPKKPKPPKVRVGLVELLVCGTRPEQPAMKMDNRTFVARDEHEARSVFRAVGHDISKLTGARWDADEMLAAKTFGASPFFLQIDGNVVGLMFALDPAVADRFGVS